jgi:ubiquinone/menaquinone biosynthesis C-methylase UbiE
MSDTLSAEQAEVRRDDHMTAKARLTEGYPGLATRSVEYFSGAVAQRADEESRIRMLLGWLDRLIDVRRRRNLLVVGCGPQPEPIRILRDQGFNAIGVEPVPLFVAAARDFLGAEGVVLEGPAEELPCPDESQDVVLSESVLEHVDSVERSLAEAERVLAPGGVAFVVTTNRHRLGDQRTEFNVPFYRFLPTGVKESYVFRHLHYDPSLANYTERPAVHWFTFTDLCRLGRAAGFSEFYSHLDLRSPEPSSFSGGDFSRRLKSKALSYVQANPWFRTIALTQRGGLIFMVKRT